ncbi:MAG: AAA family ATPase [Bacilli bacterium]|nr:AAA family ATPase [Bacilli bacterium]
MGSARSGKSTAIERISELLRKYDRKVEIIDEEYVKVTKDINKNPNKKQKINSLDYTNRVKEEKISIYDYVKEKKADVIIFDRGINDEFNWLKTFGEDNCESYNLKLRKRKVDLLIIETCDVMTSLKKKYQNSLSLVPTKWTNYEVCTAYLKSIEKNYDYFNKHTNKIFKIDTSNIKVIEASILITNEILKII